MAWNSTIVHECHYWAEVYSVRLVENHVVQHTQAAIPLNKVCYRVQVLPAYVHQNGKYERSCQIQNRSNMRDCSLGYLSLFFLRSSRMLLSFIQETLTQVSILLLLQTTTRRSPPPHRGLNGSSCLLNGGRSQP